MGRLESSRECSISIIIHLIIELLTDGAVVNNGGQSGGHTTEKFVRKNEK